MKIAPASDKLKAELDAVSKKLLAEYLDGAGDDVKKIFAAYNK
jgi:hypothetical protein